MKKLEKLAKIAINKSLLKEYSNSSQDRIVYMEDNTEFQIQIFNPYSYVIGVSLFFNENNDSYSKILVLKPGERVWLERYLDDDKKLLFSTYEVGTSKEVKEAIKNNGRITIKFYKENKHNYWLDNCTITVNQPAIPNTLDVWYCSNNNLTYNCGITASASSMTNTACYTTSIDSNANSIETGRIEKGNYSNQKFKNTNYDFEYSPFNIEEIIILPSSTKPISSTDLKKRYCSNCGRKLNTKYKFCPFCGTKI